MQLAAYNSQLTTTHNFTTTHNSQLLPWITTSIGGDSGLNHSHNSDNEWSPAPLKNYGMAKAGGQRRAGGALPGAQMTPSIKTAQIVRRDENGVC